MAKVVNKNGHAVIYDYSEYGRPWKRKNKRALVSYLTQPIIDDMGGSSINRFSNSGIGVSWVRCLNELGFKLTIMDWNDNKNVPSETYDLIVLHGSVNFNQLKKLIEPGSAMIHFCAGAYWRFSNRQELQRLKDFSARHKMDIPKERYVSISEDPVNNRADGLIVIGNEFTASTYKKYRTVIPINNANYPDNHFRKIKKDYTKAKSNWLFFAGAGNVHKGLDLAVEAFTKLEQHLYIITPLEKEFLAAYKNEAKLPNIHFVGEVPMRTEQFYEIADKCAFQVFPSCSEGQPGSVTEAMNLGIIPVVSRESGIDVEPFGEILKTNTIDEIRKTVRRLSALSAAQVEVLARQTRRDALKNHNPKKFRKDLKKAIRQIVENTYL